MPEEQHPRRPGQLRALRWRLFAAAYTGRSDDAVDVLQQLERVAADAAADDDADDAADDDADARLVAATRAVHGGHASTAMAVLTAAGPAQRSLPSGDGMSIKVFMTTVVTSRRIDADDAASLIRVAVARHKDEVTFDDVDSLLSAATYRGMHLVAEELKESFSEQALR